MPPRSGNLEHEAASATNAGWRGHEGQVDATSMFGLDVPGEDWHGVVLAVANGPAGLPVVAVDALQEHLTDSADHLAFSDHDWQTPVARTLTAAFEHADAMVRERGDDAARTSGPGLALTVALFVGDWLCVAHRRDGRVYRLSKNQLEQLTADPDSSPALGAAPPAIRFARLRPGDVVLACSGGLRRRLADEHLARLLSGRRPIADIAKSLVAVAVGRGGDDDVSACLARVGPLRAKRLPDPVGGAAAAPTPRVAGLPPFQPRRGSSLEWRRFGMALGALAAVGALSGTWLMWPASRKAAVPAAVVHSVARPQSTVAPPAPRPIDSAPPVTAPSEVPPAAPLPAPLPTLPPAASPEIVQRRLPRSERRVGDTVIAQTKAADEQRIRDSLTLLETRAAEQAAQDRRAAGIRAQQETEERQKARARAEGEAAAVVTAERLRDERVAAGKDALSGWMTALVKSVNAGTVGAAVLAAGPPGFAAFVRKNQPKLSEAKLLAVTVNEETGEAVAEWVAKWRTEFGTSTSRSMKATATAVPDGDRWRLRTWRITEGLP